MAVSREQVVQIIKGVVASPYVDQVQDFIADLEATIAEQAKELSESQSTSITFAWHWPTQRRLN